MRLMVAASKPMKAPHSGMRLPNDADENNGDTEGTQQRRRVSQHGDRVPMTTAWCVTNAGRNVREDHQNQSGSHRQGQREPEGPLDPEEGDQTRSEQGANEHPDSVQARQQRQRSRTQRIRHDIGHVHLPSDAPDRRRHPGDQDAKAQGNQ
jgi:hypothetical protein